MQFITFIIIFGIIVVVHEFGHFYFAKKSGILVREFAIGMGPKIFSHIGKDGTAYTIRILPLGGYVRMAGWGEDSTDIKVGTPASLTLDAEGKVVRINLSGKKVDQTALPMNVTGFDFEEKLEITGLVLDELKTYAVDHDATIVEEDGTEVRIAPLDVQYQNASIWGRLITNFAGPMNNFILSVLVFMLLAFVQGGVRDENSNHFQVMDGSAIAAAGVQNNDQILKINDYKISNWADLTSALAKITGKSKEAPTLSVTYKHGSETKEITVQPKKDGNRYLTNYLAIKLLAIYNFSSQAAEQGLPAVLSLLAMLSLNIGIFNLIPIPALDGGKIVLNILEAIRRKPLRRETETYITLSGVAIMVILMIAVTWNDIMKLFF